MTFKKHLSATSSALWLAAALVTGLSMTSAQAGTDANGFVDQWLILMRYSTNCDGLGNRGVEYLNDGATSEGNIIPFDGQVLGMPTGATYQPAGLPAAPTIRAASVNNTTLDFDAQVQPGIDDNDTVGYAWAYVKNVTGSGMRAGIGIGSDDSIHIRVNRETVMDIAACRGSGGAGAIQDRGSAFLLPGWNLVQVKVFDGCCGWEFRLRFEDSLCEPIRHGAGQIEVHAALPPGEELSIAPPGTATRTIATMNPTADTTRADVSVAVASGGLPSRLTETFSIQWTPSSISAGGVVTPVNATTSSIVWSTITDSTASYALTRTGKFRNVNADRRISGNVIIATSVQRATGGDLDIGGALSFPAWVPQVLVTPALGQAAVGTNPTCAPSPARILGGWIDDGGAFDDAGIVPVEGMLFRPEFDDGDPGTGPEASQSNGWSLPPATAEGDTYKNRFWEGGIAADPATANGILVPVSTTDGVGRYDWQNGNIYGVDIDNAMNVAYFYAVNTGPTVAFYQMGLGTDDSALVRVNGRPAYHVSFCRGDSEFGDKFQIALDPGKNLIAVYTFEGGGGFAMKIRFEDAVTGVSIPNDFTTIDPTGYNPSPAAHPEHTVGGLKFVNEVLITPAFMAPAGCSVTAAQISGNWIGNGAGLTDNNIVPTEGFVFRPAFGTASSQSTGFSTGLSNAYMDRFWTNRTVALASAKLVRMMSSDGIFDPQRGEAYNADVNNNMSVAYFYAINTTDDVIFPVLAFGSDDGGGVRVNGRQAHALQACRGTGFTDRFKIALDPGPNLIAGYHFEDGGGQGQAFRFEDDFGVPIAITTTVDPSGYQPDPDGTLGIHPVHQIPPIVVLDPPAYVTTGASTGIVTQFLVPAAPLNQPRGSDLGNRAGLTVPEDYLSIAGQPPSAANVKEGARVMAGTTGQITTSVRGSECGTYLVKFQGRGGDPGLFDGEVFYAPPGDPNSYSSTLFFFLNNKTAEDQPVYVGFGSDDSATAFVNGQRVAEHTVGRGFGGANEIQTGPSRTMIPPGLSLVQVSYIEGGGGSGARVGVFANNCRGALDLSKVEVSANPPGFVQPDPLPPCVSVSSAPQDEHAFKEMPYVASVRATSYVPARADIPAPTYSIVGAPAGTSIDAATGDITYSIPKLNGSGTVLNFEVRAAIGGVSDTASWNATVTTSVRHEFLLDDVPSFDLRIGQGGQQNLNDVSLISDGDILAATIPGPGAPDFDNWCGFDRTVGINHKIHAFSTFNLETRMDLDDLALPVVTRDAGAYDIGLSIDRTRVAQGQFDIHILGIDGSAANWASAINSVRNCCQDGDCAGDAFVGAFIGAGDQTGKDPASVNLRIEKRGNNTKFLARLNDEDPYTQVQEVNGVRPWPVGVGLAAKTWGAQGTVGIIFDYLEYGQFTPCPAGDTTCSSLVVTGPNGAPGAYTATITGSDAAGDPVAYTFKAESAGSPSVVVGPQSSNTAVLNLGVGNWTITATVDDDPDCPNAAGASCQQTINICPTAGDTHCSGLVVTGPAGNGPGEYTAATTAVDDSGDSISYTFRAEKAGSAPIVVGPGSENTAKFNLVVGVWSISVSVDDSAACADVAVDATCTQQVTVVQLGGRQRPYDADQNGQLQITDGVALLTRLFVDNTLALPCGANTNDPGNLKMFDADGNGSIQVTDPVALLSLLFVDNTAQLNSCIGPGAVGCKCILIEGCPDAPPASQASCPSP